MLRARYMVLPLADLSVKMSVSFGRPRPRFTELSFCSHGMGFGLTETRCRSLGETLPVGGMDFGRVSSRHAPFQGVFLQVSLLLRISLLNIGLEELFLFSQ